VAPPQPNASSVNADRRSGARPITLTGDPLDIVRRCTAKRIARRTIERAQTRSGRRAGRKTERHNSGTANGARNSADFLRPSERRRSTGNTCPCTRRRLETDHSTGSTWPRGYRTHGVTTSACSAGRRREFHGPPTNAVLILTCVREDGCPMIRATLCLLRHPMAFGHKCFAEPFMHRVAWCAPLATRFGTRA
jgi:hypothetical protein